MSRLSAIRAALPQGRTLPDDVWRRRHRWMLNLLWAHAVALPLLGLARGFGIAHTVGHAVPMVACALAATHFADRRRGAAVLVSLGLLTSSAELVHILDGLTEAHFHFFVMISVLTLYEDWLPFLVAVGFVVLHHGVYGAIEPEGVYNHPGNPFALAALHGAFVLAAGVANVLAWRLNEDVRGELREAYDATRLSLDTAKAFEAELHARASQQAAIAQFGREALERGALEETMKAAVQLLRRELGVEVAAILEHLPSEGEFAVRASIQAEDPGARIPGGQAS